MSSHCYYSEVVLCYIGTGGALKKKALLQVIQFHGRGGEGQKLHGGFIDEHRLSNVRLAAQLKCSTVPTVHNGVWAHL